MGGQSDQLDFYRLSPEATLKQLHSHKDGLTPPEAEARLKEHGPNRLEPTLRDPYWLKYLRQYKDLMILLLLGSSFISAVLLGDTRTGLVLLALVLLNTIIGFSQEFKAERLMESLEKLIINEARVQRGGHALQIPATELVVGDVVYVEAGNSVPADLRLIEETELASNDFALTGESEPSRKFTHAIDGNVELANRHNLVFMGTTIATGNGYGVVIHTGMQTELGRIASLSSGTAADVSPLQRELNHTATRVTQGAFILCLALLAIAIQADLGFKEALLFAIAIAISVIPQGLPAEINTALAQAANRLAKARALVKKLSAVESLGATSIICTDKTGTLTTNQMTVQQVFVGKNEYAITGTGYEPVGQILSDKKPLTQLQLHDMRLLFITGALASNARISPADDQHATYYTIGDPTEGALLTLAEKAGIASADLDEDYPELKEFSFDSARKRMSSVRRFTNDQRYVFVKGAPESVLECCEDIWDHGHVRKMTTKDRASITACNESQAENAMRNLALAYKVLPDKQNLDKLSMEDTESDLVYLGMVSMADPLREEVAGAITAAKAAHIKISIVTGDFATTARAIAQKAGLGGKDIPVISGEELRAMGDAEVLRRVVAGGTIFSRVSPEDKLRIVGLAKDSGRVVAVTGDGINDAPALKRADIGVAMGLTGTDVAKQSAEIVLLDDSFKTLVGAVQQGRVIFQNIKKGTLSCFTSNASELIVNLTSLAAFSMFGIPLAMTVMQILAIDLIAELFPIAALGWDPAEGELMKESPRNPRHHILNRDTIQDLIFCGFIIGGLAFANYLWLINRAGISPSNLIASSPVHLQATSLTYLTIILCQFVNIMQRRSVNGFFTRYQFSNRYFWLAIAFSLFCVANIIYNPILQPYFSTADLSAVDWAYAAAAAVIFLIIREVQRHANKHHHRDHILELLAKT